MPIRKLRFGYLLISMALICAGEKAFADETQLTAALQQRYKLATIRLTEKGDSKLEAGVILTVKSAGIVSFGEKDASYAELCPSEFKKDRIHTPKGSACNGLAPKSRQFLKPSARVTVTAIRVRENFDSVSFFLLSCDEPRRALLVFRFSKGALAKSTVAQIEKVIEQALGEPDERMI